MIHNFLNKQCVFAGEVFKIVRDESFLCYHVFLLNKDSRKFYFFCTAKDLLKGLVMQPVFFGHQFTFMIPWDAIAPAEPQIKEEGGL